MAAVVLHSLQAITKVPYQFHQPLGICLTNVTVSGVNARKLMYHNAVAVVVVLVVKVVVVVVVVVTAVVEKY